MRQVLTNPDLERTFLQQGYVVVPLLQREDVDRLYGLFMQHHEQFTQTFHTSHFSKDKGYKQEVHDTIASVLEPHLKGLLSDYLPVFGNFMIKQPDPDVFMPLHADWAYVNEAEFRSVAVWVPLVDTDEENGCLGVIPGSHRIMNAIRGPRIQQSSYSKDKDWVKELGVLLPMKAGEAVIYDHALMHYSPPNKSPFPRPALNLSLVPNGADMIHYCVPEGSDNIEVYHVQDTSFFINYDNYQRPETDTMTATLPTNIVGWIDDKMDVLIPRPASVEAPIQAEKAPAKKGLFARLFGI